MSVMPMPTATNAEATPTQQAAAGEVTSQGEATSQDKSAKIYAEMVRREKALRAREESLKSQLAEKEQAWMQKEQEFQSKYIPKDKLLTDTLGTLQDAGLSYDQLMQLALNPPSQEQMINMQLQQKIKDLEEKLESRFNSYEESQKQSQAKQYEQALGTIKNEAQALIQRDADTFEFISSNGQDGLDAVVGYIEYMFKETGRAPSVQEAAQEVEKHLEEDYMKVLNLKKIKSKLGQVEQAPTPQGQSMKPQVSQKTLTNTNAPQSTRPMTPRERAMAAFHGQKF